MLYDPRMRGLGRGVHKTRKKVKRETHVAFIEADVKNYNGESTDGRDPANDQMMRGDGTWDTEANSLSDTTWGGWMETQPWPASAPSSSSKSLGSCSPPGDGQWTQDPGNGWPTTSRTGSVEFACGPTSLQTDGVFQTAMAEIPSSTSSATLFTFVASEEPKEMTDATLSTSSSGHNTWITATSNEALSSGVTIVPFITLRTSPTTRSPSMATSAYPASARLSSSTISSSTSQSVTSAPVSVPRVAQINGVSPSDKAGTVAGITVGAAVLVLLIVVAALAYVRGGRMRGLSSDTQPRKLRSIRNGLSTRKGREGRAQEQETIEVSLDVEQGSTASGSRRTEEKESWEDVDLRGVTRSNTKGDDVRWLEAWCRDKEKMMAQPPELRFNPALPLPPIILEGTERHSS